MGEDIISVAFLALFAIIVSCIMISMVPTVAVMPMFALIAICLWIAYDYMLRQREVIKKECVKKRNKSSDLDEKIKQLTDELETDMADISEVDGAGEVGGEVGCNCGPKCTCRSNTAIGPDYDYRRIFKETGCSGDNKLANRMKYMGMQDKIAQNARSKWNVEKFRPYVEEELRAGEARDWWDSEADYLDALM